MNMKRLIYLLTLILSPIVGFPQLNVIGGPNFNGTNIYSYCASPSNTQFSPDLSIENPGNYDLSLITWEVQYNDGGVFKNVTDTGASPNVIMPVPQTGAIIIVWYRKGTIYEERYPSSPDEINIFAEQKPIIDLDDKLIVCNGDPMAITPTTQNENPSGFYKYEWKDRSGTTLSTSSYTFYPSDTGIYYYSVSFIVPENCSTRDSIIVKNITPTANLGNDLESCRNEEVTITNQWLPRRDFDGTLSYEWDNASITNDKTYTTSSNGNITLQVTASENGKKCFSNIDTIFIQELPTPFINLGEDIDVIDGPVLISNQISNGPSGIGFDYSWTDSTGLEIAFDDTVSIINSGIYTLTITHSDPSMCQVREEIIIKIKNDPNKEPDPVGGIVFVATAFAPEGTVEENQYLRINGTNISEDDFIFMVFDRWGGIMYETTNLNDASLGWNGASAPSGVYTFTIKGKYKDGTEINETGNSTLIR